VPAPIWVAGLLIPKPINGGWSTICHPWVAGSPPRQPPATWRQPAWRGRGLRGPCRHDPDPAWRRAPGGAAVHWPASHGRPWRSCAWPSTAAPTT